MDTSTSSVADTLTTFAALSTVTESGKKKLPSAICKNSALEYSHSQSPTSLQMTFWSNIRLVRDEWESEQKELEFSLSALLGVKWQVSIDAESLYPLAEERFVKEDPGVMFREWVLSGK